MKIVTRTIILVLLVFGLVLCGCGRNGKTEESTISLTGVRTAVTLPLPEGSVPFLSVMPEWDADTNTLLCAAASWTDGEGYGVTSLIRTGADGYGKPVPVPLGEEERVFLGAVRGGVLYWLRARYGNDGIRQLSLERFDEGGENTLLADDILPVFSAGLSNMRMIASDSAICVAADTGTAVFGLEGTLRTIYPSPGSIASLTVSPDGDVLLGYRNGNTLKAAAVDMNTGLAGDPMDLPDFPTAVSAGGGAYRFFCSCREGIVGRTADGKNEVLMDPSVSGAGNAVFCFASGAEAFFFTEGDLGDRKLLLFIPADDTELTGAAALTVALPFWRGGELTNDEKQSLAAFQRTHPGVTIVLDDCERYRVPDADLKISPDNTSDEILVRIAQAKKDMDDRLSTDIVTGLYQPDLLIANIQCGTFTQICRKGLYADLVLYLEQDDRVRLDDLMDNVRRVYDDGQGGIWGLARSFYLSTIVTSPDRMPGVAEKGYMMISDLLDCLDNLPQGVELVRGWGQGTFEAFLLHEKGYLAFTDMKNAACSFVDPVFIGCLDRLKMTEAIPDQVYYGSGLELVRNGKVATEWQQSWKSPDEYMASCLAFDTKDIAVIGYPSPEARPGAGTRVESMGNTYAILASSQYGDLAWELVRQFIDDYHYADPDKPLAGTQVFPALKSRFEEMNSFYEGRAYCLDSEGRLRSGSTLEELENLCPGAGEEGKHIRYTAEDGRRLMEICGEAGLPLSMTPYEKIGDIISEEISAFLGGVGTAEDCAKKIQSRASIWLAEHS